MTPTIEPKPHDDLKRVIFDSHPWPLVGECDVALHEAGHIAVGLALGFPCFNARIVVGGDAGQAGVLAGVGETIATVDTLPPPEDVAEVYQLAGLVLWPGLPPAEAALNSAVMLAGGRAAELVGAGIRLPGELRINDPDHLQCRALLAATGQRLAMTWVQRMARCLLTSAWADVESIAAELRATGVWTNPSAWVRESRPPSTTGDIENAN